MPRRLLVLCVVASMLVACSGGSGCAERACTRVLFVGNSYTSVNDLPATFVKLAASGGHDVQTAMLAEGGWTLAQHVASAETAGKLASARWDVVVLQEQSQIPSVDRSQRDQMYPAARQLVRLVRDAGARPIFFDTWARRDGWPENGMTDYAAMQAAIDGAYLAIAGEQSAAVAAVGAAWQRVVSQEPKPGLWQADGSHPTMKGTYLAACVFYATIFSTSPQGLSYRAGLPSAEAAYLQRVASDTVLNSARSRASAAAE
jgi:hypothetical protein